MSDILVQAALREQALLTQELIEVQSNYANYAASKKATGYSGTAECDRISIESFAYTPSCTLRWPDGYNRAGFPVQDWLCFNNPLDQIDAVNDVYCKTFGQFTKPRKNGLFLHETAWNRCNSECLWTVPAGVNRVQIQMWGPGGGSSGVCCQGMGTGGPNGAYSVIEFNVTPGDTMCLCAGCAYCCYGDNSGPPGQNNSYCTTVCYCDVAAGNGSLIMTAGSPDPHTCRWNCSWCNSFGWNNCCSMQLGGRWGILNNMDVFMAGCMCSFGENFSCIRGINTCGSCWGTCYQADSTSMIPAHYDFFCGFCSNLAVNVDCRNTKNVKHYGVFASWPGFWLGSSCCLGNGNSGTPTTYHYQLPTVGWPNSWNIVNPDGGAMYGKAFGTTITCCSIGCHSPMACHGHRKAPGVGGTGRFSRQPGYICGDFGRAGAICVSWNCT